jgi:hypothetical protein
VWPVPVVAMPGRQRPRLLQARLKAKDRDQEPFSVITRSTLMPWLFLVGHDLGESARLIVCADVVDRRDAEFAGDVLAGILLAAQDPHGSAGGRRSLAPR